MPKTLPATKHFKLAQTLRAQIRKMNAGEPLPTVLQLRERFNVSQATVDRALDRLRREGLINRPAGQLRPVVTDAPISTVHRVALIRPTAASATFDEQARAIVEAGRRKDWAFEFANYGSYAAVNLREALSDFEGAVFMATADEFPPDLISALRRPRRPVVLLREPSAGLRVSSVTINEPASARLAVGHLWEQGHRRILLLQNETDCPAAGARAAGWRREMTERGAAAVDELVVDCQTTPGENALLAAYSRLKQWISQPHPKFTAAYCASASGATALLRVLREHGIRVPEQVSVISHGDAQRISAFQYPPLTAVEADLNEFGRLVIEVLEEQMTDSTLATKHVVVPAELIVRESTGMVLN